MAPATAKTVQTALKDAAAACQDCHLLRGFTAVRLGKLLDDAYKRHTSESFGFSVDSKKKDLLDLGVIWDLITNQAPFMP